MIEPYSLNFTTNGILCLKASSIMITPFPKGLTTTWRNLPLQLYPKFPPGGSIFSKVLWEITWANFRFNFIRFNSLLVVPGSNEDPLAYSTCLLHLLPQSVACFRGCRGLWARKAGIYQVLPRVQFWNHPHRPRCEINLPWWICTDRVWMGWTS